MFAVKICGMRTAQDVRVCAMAGADAVGFIFVGGPARLELSDAIAAAACTPVRLTRVGVFADQGWDFVHAAAERCALHMLQFCGNETAAFRGSFGLPTIAVVGVQPMISVALPSPDFLREARAEAVLIDAQDGERRGGTGLTVDPEVARALVAACSLPCILAGGLRAENVGAAIASIRPMAVDVRTGVEREGCKDPSLVGAFVNAVRSARLVNA